MFTYKLGFDLQASEKMFDETNLVLNISDQTVVSEDKSGIEELESNKSSEEAALETPADIENALETLAEVNNILIIL